MMHDDLSKVSRIFDDQNTIKNVLDDYIFTIRKFKQNLILNNDLIKNPLKSEMAITQTYLDNLIALFQISKSCQDGATRKDLLGYLGIKTYDNIFEKGSISKKILKL